MFTCSGEIIKRLYRKSETGEWMYIDQQKGDKAKDSLIDDYVCRTYKYSNIKRISHTTKTMKDYVCKVITVYYTNDCKAVYYL